MSRVPTPLTNPRNLFSYARALQGANLIHNTKPPARKSGSDEGNDDSGEWSPKTREALASFTELALLHARARAQGFVNADKSYPALDSKVTYPQGWCGYQIRDLTAPKVKDFEEAGMALEEAVEKGMDVGYEDGRLSEEAEWLSRLQVRELTSDQQGGEMGDRYW